MSKFDDFLKVVKVGLVSLTQTAAGSSITRTSPSYNSLVKLSLLTLITTILGWTVVIDFFNLNLKNFNIALAQAPRQRFLQTDNNGDYYIADRGGNPLPREWENRSFLLYEFKVADNDPNGLNCRASNMMIHDGSDIYNHPVVDIFYQGELITSSGIISDDRGLPWVRIQYTPSSTRSTRYSFCFVRANTKYLDAVRYLQRLP